MVIIRGPPVYTCIACYVTVFTRQSLCTCLHCPYPPMDVLFLETEKRPFFYQLSLNRKRFCSPLRLPCTNNKFRSTSHGGIVTMWLKMTEKRKYSTKRVLENQNKGKQWEANELSSLADLIWDLKILIRGKAKKTHKIEVIIRRCQTEEYQQRKAFLSKEKKWKRSKWGNQKWSDNRIRKTYLFQIFKASLR